MSTKADIAHRAATAVDLLKTAFSGVLSLQMLLQNMNLNATFPGKSVLRATVAVQEAAESDPRINALVNFNAGFVAVGLLYADCPEGRPKALDPFFNLTSLMATVAPTTNGTILSLSKAMANPTTPGNGYAADERRFPLYHPTGLDGRVLTAEWPEDGDDAAAHQAVDTMTDQVRSLARGKGLLPSHLSMNFANSSQDALRSYGAENGRRLQEAAAKYDPS
ncbi:hypothetical protein F4677DRAFT_441931 [Hypoxylon crocopeplum]|nr:hypothetical protein F4677DRAFT_441931 [Hypoxylon crocopeplum]